MKEILKDTFNAVYLLKYGHEYSFRNKNVDKGIDSFLNKIPKNAGEDWLYDFTIFQFAYYEGMKTRFDRVYLNWIYGDKALDRWDKRTETQVFFANQFKVKLGVKKDMQPLSASEYRDSERWRFKDMNRQFIHCEETYLFEVKNDVCKACPMYKVCITKEK